MIELQYPLNTIWVTQKFGGNNLSVYKSNGMLGHNGVDFAAQDGTPVFATHDGTCYLEIDGSGGNGVVLYSDKEYDYDGKPTFIKTIYWHLKEHNNKVVTGQKVKTGDIVGLADNTGYSTGSHLHFALKPCLKNETKNSWYNLEQNNGYFGAIDPQPFFNGKFPPFKYTNTKLLKYGMWNTPVVHLQKKLQGLGFYTANCDGAFGPKTLSAVKNYQKSVGLVPDGIVGKLTNAKLSL